MHLLQQRLQVLCECLEKQGLTWAEATKDEPMGELRNNHILLSPELPWHCKVSGGQWSHVNDYCSIQQQERFSLHSYRRQ